MKLQTYSTKQKLPNNTSLIKRLLFFLPIIKFVVKEESMQPLLFPGNVILVNRLAKGRVGDIIILKNPQKDTPQIYLIKQIAKEKNNHVYVVGLHKKKSVDSRHFGWVDKKNIIGKMILKL